MDEQTRQVALRTGLAQARVEGCCRLLTEGNTVPFIARYRKEATGGLDEVQIRAVEDALADVAALLARRKAVLAGIERQGKLTEELRRRIEACWDRQELEDLYLPYKQRRTTRADVAREAGLEPLARQMLGQEPPTGTTRAACAAPFVGLLIAADFPGHQIGAQRKARPSRQLRCTTCAPQGAGDVSNAADGAAVADQEVALQGARDIVADVLATHAPTRARVRELARGGGRLCSRKKRGAAGEDIATFSDYFEHQEPVSSAAAHRVLAMLRGEDRGALSLSIGVSGPAGVEIMNRDFIGRVPGLFRTDFLAAGQDGWERLLWPSVEREVLALLKERADGTSVRVFEENLRALLMEAPARGRRVLGVDPGFRNGCKLACVDERGRILGTATVYPHPPQSQAANTTAALLAWHGRFGFQVAAVGDGTAHRETMSFLETVAWPAPVEVAAVREAGASVYSASPLAAREMPDLDVTLRGAVSIARRFQDPLAELVKIEPQALGVGQYQHDVDQRLLERGLDAVVEECVNRVGVELNTASAELLARVAGIGPTTARAIVAHRGRHGSFSGRNDLLSVSGIGPARYQQAAGFLRIVGGEEPFDGTGIHPERYAEVRRALALAGLTMDAVLGHAEVVERLGRAVTPEQLGIGAATWQDILAELARPGRDPRGERVAFRFGDVHSIADLSEGMLLPGRVTNITDFGAFVDIGVHRDGLVHISCMADRRVASPFDVCRPGMTVKVKVIGIDHARQRISLSLRPSDCGE